MTRVDAHHHVWRVDRGDYGWLTPDLPIHRDYGLDDLRPLLGDIAATVLVQAAPTDAETQCLLEVARASAGLVRGVVGWTDLSSAEAPLRVARLGREPLLKGLRPMLQDIPDTAWILRPEVQPALFEMAARGLVFDALIQPRHLPVVPELGRWHPTLRIVIDHAAKPDIAGGGFQEWAADIARAACETSALCKLSGLATEAAPDWDVQDLQPYVAHLLDVFGPHRLSWGSDWPVVNLAGSYARWRDATLELLRDLPDAGRDAVLGGTAAAVYEL